MKLCDYGCGQEGKFQFANGLWCCSKTYRSCPSKRKPIKDQPELCDYGCGQKAIHYFKYSNKWCCNKNTRLCPGVIQKSSKTRTGIKFQVRPSKSFENFDHLLCDYGCEQEAKYQLHNGKVCCSLNFESCKNQRLKKLDIVYLKNLKIKIDFQI